MGKHPLLRVSVFISLLLAMAAQAVQLKINLPLGRVAYQTNEMIDLAIVRSDVQALPAADLLLTVGGEDGSALSFAFPVKAVDTTKATEHLHLNGWLLRPGAYTVTAAMLDATAQVKIEVYSHIRKSSFRLIDWGCPTNGAVQTILGEDGLGFNLLYASYGGHDQNANLRGGMDYIRNCTMGGAHQMDMRLECDWSDPYVLGGGRARAVREALKDRTSPNVLGVHFYDEPGLTWLSNPKSGEFTGHGIPAQERAFKDAFGVEPPYYKDVKKDDPASVAAWDNWARWKLAFMDAAWKYGAYGVNLVRSDFLTATQSVYGWHAFGDGYYFNVARSLPVISGHGGYDDYAGGFMNAAFYHTMGRIRDMEKPNWYLPTWWDMSSSLYRLEQHLSFIENLQGMCKPPNNAAEPAKLGSSDGIVETNKLYARLGTIFTTMPPTRSEVAVLYSMSQNVAAQAQNMMNFQDFAGQVERLELLYFASKMSKIPLTPLVEEDVLDGTLAMQHKAIVLTGIERMDPRVVKVLEDFAASGGTVILTDDCTITIKGAKKLGAPVTTDIYIAAQKANAAAGNDRTPCLIARRPGAYFKAAAPIAKALVARCAEIGVKPFFESDNPMVVGSRQAQGDIEYLFAVNATVDESRLQKVEDMNAIKSAQAMLRLPADGRPVYDAVLGGPAMAFAKKGNALAASLRFGPGQLRAFARTARPIGGVQVPAPILSTDTVRAGAPVRLTVTAVLVDDKGAVLSGSAPLQIRVVDPLGAVRYNLFRATAQGICRLDLPLAANDPSGKWTVNVYDLLAGTTGATSFTYTAPAQCGAAAAATRRAVYFGNDWQNIYRFFRSHRNVVIVAGKSAYDADAAGRLVESLRPWGITCTVVSADEVNKPEPQPKDDAFFAKMGGKNSWVGPAGFDVPGPAVLLGNPDDNPLIKSFANTQQQWGSPLPYAPGPDFPGPGRGYLAWQTDVVRQGVESITCIANDAAGMSEAVGTLYEAMAGLDPQTPMVPPSASAVKAAAQRTNVFVEAPILWQTALPDRPAWMTAANGQVTACTLDGSLVVLDAKGKVISSKDASKADLDAGPKRSTDVKAIAKTDLAPDRVVKMVVEGNGMTAVGYWGGTLQIFDLTGHEKIRQLLPQDIAAMAWSGNSLVVGLADGRAVGLDVSIK